MSSNSLITKRSEKFISNTKPSKDELDSYTVEVKSRTLKLLEAMVTHSHMNQKDIEKELGYKKSYLTKLFDSDIELRVDHVIRICYMLEFPASVFWKIVYEDETLNLDSFDNGLVRRLKSLLIYVYGKEPNKLAAALGHVEPDREEMKFKPYSFAESRKD